ncbi:MAG: hypothetical protein ABI972_24250 [Acidobacteriota bacterium]
MARLAVDQLNIDLVVVVQGPTGFETINLDDGEFGRDRQFFIARKPVTTQ